MEDGLLKTHAADVALPASSGFFGGGWPGTVVFSRKLSAKRITIFIIFCIICITVGLLIHFQSPNTSQAEFVVPEAAAATQTTIGTSVIETTPSPEDPGCVGACTLECGWDMSCREDGDGECVCT